MNDIRWSAGADKYILMTCTDGCKMYYHHQCWKEAEKACKEVHDQWKLKVRLSVRVQSRNSMHFAKEQEPHNAAGCLKLIAIAWVIYHLVAGHCKNP